jgi:formate dehydrogenase assembly factor FdhD
MPKRRSNARLFEADGYTFKCWIDPLEAQEKFERGELDLATHPASNAVIGYRLRESFQKSDPAALRPSQATITLAEMLLNVGLPVRLDISPTKQAIEAAQHKIEFWPLVWNERATRLVTQICGAT